MKSVYVKTCTHLAHSPKYRYDTTRTLVLCTIKILYTLVLKKQSHQVRAPGMLSEFDGHTLQVELPMLDLKVPAKQMVQFPGCPVKPFGHGPASSLQSFSASLPAAESFPDGQLRQWVSESAERSGEYLPAAQSRHMLGSTAPETVEYLPFLHPVHVDSAVAPSSEENFPWQQSSQVETDEAPFTSEYFPRAQSKQVACDVAPAAGE